MRMLNAATLEADDPAVAIGELLEQLDLEKNLLKNSVGFITCSADFVETGIATAICEALPFEVAGCTTLSNANNNAAGTMLLCLSVLTADDASFATAISQPLSGDPAQVPGLVKETYQEAAAQLDGEPKLIFTFMPMLTTASGEVMLAPLNQVAGGAPIFGTIACDFDSVNYSNTSVIHNGVCASAAMSMIVVAGNVKPRFVLASISEKSLHRQHAVITSSQGCVMKEVNGMSAKEYLFSIGLLDGVGIAAAASLPFVVNYNDGSQPVARAIYAINDDGSAACGGLMPEGGILAICHLDLDDILFTAGQTVRNLLESGEVNGILTFSCLGRNMALGPTPLIEAEKVKETMADRAPWHMAYSGGETCPVYTAERRIINRFHNFTFIGCAL